MTRETNELNPEDFIVPITDYTDGSDEAYDAMLYAEETERQENEMLETGRFGEVRHGRYDGDLILDSAAAIKQSALQAHSDYCLTHGIRGSVYAGMADAFKPKDL